ncbi:polysaccharide biosynthesis tyrosine autokinase [Desulfobacula toluolica]|uniref:Putaitve capsular exopolysaccharide family protein n=1 Tax=Desulfobacula toluolica (strain DSM 7467 / Tol2) TaxID=651182 RepID=K0N4A5_DESTT|nr:polysaccharide biosynthesis tyrosine autokinase [Desulfobacula toluolica]CCK78944.1 putaitve capsular exopolysaccharide family protein [Desulfobacula toluolica Tol2]
MFSKSKKTKNQTDRENLLDHFPSSSTFAESYRTLRTNLFFTVMEKDLKSVVVTSSVEGEGKTTTSVNLAHAITQTNQKVLLVDLDLRRPHLSSLFSMKKKTGVTDLVANTFGIHLGQGSLEEFSVDDLIQLTKLQKRTCRLSLENDENQVGIFFEKGLIVDIYWKNRPKSKNLANTLIRNKLLTEKEAYLALGHQKKSVQRLGTILYTMGFVSKKDIFKTLSVQTIEAIRVLSSMETGQFEFSGVSSEAIKQSISQNIDFEKLYTEFKINDNQGPYLKKAIESVIQPTNTPNLFILPSGPVSPNPSELVGSERVTFLIDHLKKQFDFIIIDTPPVMPATDALIIADRVDGTILVIRSGNTDRKIIKEVIGQYETARQPIIGTVLNRVNMKKEGYYRYYKKYYSSYYN